jgi:hypothetical protein
MNHRNGTTATIQFFQDYYCPTAVQAATSLRCWQASILSYLIDLIRPPYSWHSLPACFRSQYVTTPSRNSCPCLNCHQLHRKGAITQASFRMSDLQVSPIWALQQTSDSVLLIAKGVLKAATSDNVQPLSLLVAEAFGNTLAICQ